MKSETPIPGVPPMNKYHKILCLWKQKSCGLILPGKQCFKRNLRTTKTIPLTTGKNLLGKQERYDS